MGVFTLQRASGRHLRLSVRMGPSHTASDLDKFHRALVQLTKKHKFKAKKRSPKKKK